MDSYDKLKKDYDRMKKKEEDKIVAKRLSEEASPTDINSLQPHRVSEVICVKCLKRWVSVALSETPLIQYHCPECGPGYVITTGQWEI